MKLRCSSLPRAMACPQSVAEVPGALAIGGDSDASRLGVAVHELLADYVRTDKLPTNERKNEVAVKHGIADPAGDMHFLFWAGVEAWRELRDGFQPDPMVEMAMEGGCDPKFTGHMDAAKDAGAVVRGLDWKSGRKPTDYYPQMMGYIVLLFDNFPAAEKAILHTVWLREKMVDTITKTRDESAEWYKEAASRLTSNLYCPGEACRFCPRQTECLARTAMVRSTLADLTDADPQVSILTPETWAAIAPSLTEAWGRVELVESAIDRFKAVVREGVERFGPLTVTDKTELRLVPVNPKKSLDTMKAWSVVSEQLTDAELADCTTVSLTDVQKIVSDKAARGQKKAAKETLLASLRTAGAVIETPQSPRLTEVRKEENTQTKEVE
jgi:hypothetical protein